MTEAGASRQDDDAAALPERDARGFDRSGRHWLPVRVYYEDTDFTGLVYHANYLRFFERGRSDFLREAGVSHTSLLERADPAAFALTRITVDYVRAARIEDRLWIATRYSGAKGAKLSFTQEALRARALDLVATADVTAVFIHPDGRPRRPLRDLMPVFESYREGRGDGEGGAGNG